MNQTLKGQLMTVAGAIAWGLSGACGQYLMSQSQVSPLYLTALRMIIAGICLTIVAAIKQPQTFSAFFKEKRDILKLVIFSIVGLLACQVTYLLAIHHSNAGTATVLEYTCPVLIVIYVSLGQRVMPSRMEMVAIGLALVGTFVIATHGNPFSLSLTPEGLFWGLISAVTYALYTIIPGDLLRRWGALFVCGLGLLIGGICFFIAIGGWRYTIVWQEYTFWAFIGIILVGTVLAYTLFLAGVAVIGPVNGSLLASAEPISSVFFSVLLLNESFQLVDMAGIAMILIAVYLITIKDKLVERRRQQGRL